MVQVDSRPNVNFVINQLENFKGTTSSASPYGIGAAIENAVGILLNNDRRSDTQTHEIKTTEGKCDVTLFTKTPERGSTYDIVLHYGYYDRKNRKSYMKDIKSTTTDLYCKADEKGIGIYDYSTNIEVCYWSHDHCSQGYNKITNILKVTTKSKIVGENKKNFSVEALQTFNNFNLFKFIELLNSGAISISPRRYFTSSSLSNISGKYPSRDRGCAFRISQRYFNELYI
jgi:hypothetical protein